MLKLNDLVRLLKPWSFRRGSGLIGAAAVDAGEGAEEGGVGGISAAYCTRLGAQTIPLASARRRSSSERDVPQRTRHSRNCHAFQKRRGARKERRPALRGRMLREAPGATQTEREGC